MGSSAVRAPLRHLLPGLALLLVVALGCLAVNRAVPLLSALLLAVLVGAAARNLGWLPRAAEPGLRSKLPLRLGVVLLGLKLSVPAVLALGVGPVVVVLVTVVATFAAVLWLGHRLGLEHDVSVLVATGCAICGAAAVAAVTTVLPSEDEAEEERLAESAATAVATVTLFGTVALLAVPGCAHLLGMPDARAGVWIGSSVHEVGQVVAGAHLLGAGATTTAVLTKLGRVVLLAPLVALVGWWERRRGDRTGARAGTDAEVQTPAGPSGRAPLVPWFVVGFLLLVAVRSLLPLPAGLLGTADLAATLLLTMGMLAMGAEVRLGHLARAGRSALVLGAAAAVLSAGVSLVAVLLVG